MKIKKNKLNKM